MASVTIDKVRKTFGAHTVLHGVDIDIRDGEFLILVGPSGCGKSTLLRMIAGLEDISSGEILIDKTVVNDIEPKSRNIAMVFQSYALYPHMTVAENMAFALTLQKTDKTEIAKRVAKAAEILSLEPLLQRLPKQLSGGQRQRVAMGRAIVRNPAVFLFDEPLSNLDAKLRVQMRSEIKELHQRLKTTTIYVTHDQIEAMTMADRIVVMRDGAIEQIGTPLELYNSPCNLFVAGFIGSPGMNFIEGTIKDGRFSTNDGVSLPLPASHSHITGKVIYGIRPEHLVIDATGASTNVITVEPTGAEVHLSLRLGSQTIVAALRDGPTLKPGDELTLLANIERVHVFDAETGHRIGAHELDRAA
ncbi:sn-glycerol-3-phosphate ABC transporter ATP-binding protein UgpC [Rhizobium sp. S152]|uniref:ABC transporter ATP-binding protein n=1 Tax=Rhizobium sp. S152 TaxID=3055038 RepID=UPI0025A94B86|nr:sn-glycerol-3-phosphate ABC transporter ATP-binding protein UgpC [Rhizobium sp. S152]MDM9625273.1 sn-glycerol-3-phosphate ABC transporter ATP-binding protein UgpC [Rhizobium sp. S152]